MKKMRAHKNNYSKPFAENRVKNSIEIKAYSGYLLSASKSNQNNSSHQKSDETIKNQKQHKNNKHKKERRRKKCKTAVNENASDELNAKTNKHNAMNFKSTRRVKQTQHYLYQL